MTEALLRGQLRLESARHALKNFLWSAASRFALHGLCPWEPEDRWVMLRHHEIFLPGLGKGLDGAKIAHISDLHCCPFMRELHLLRYFEMVNQLEADFIVLTGDFISASSRHYVRRIGKLLSNLSAHVEVMAVLGNHDHGLFHPQQEVVRGLGDYVAGELNSAGIRVLINKSRSFTKDGSTVCFVGLGELWTEDYLPAVAFEGVPPDRPTIALCHNPDDAPHLANLGATYVLSGHTHGQITRGSRIHNLLFPKKNRQFIAGQYNLGHDRFVYVNRGIGPSRRARPDTRPEIALFTLRDLAQSAYRPRPWAGTVTNVEIPGHWQETELGSMVY